MEAVAGNILVVEDESVIRKALRRLLERHNYRVSEASSVQQATQIFSDGKFDLIISDLRLPGAAGTELISAAKHVPVLIMTSYASLKSAVDSMKMGAVDYIAKPFDHQDMLSSVNRIISSQNEQPEQEPTVVDGSDSSCNEIVGNCASMQAMFSRIHKVAPTNTTILIHGETGTGKELVASAIHRQSKRLSKSMVCVNCAAIPDTLIESELFGYEKGAFTGANTNRLGLIEAADGGTLFLDEIGELPIEAQARLLRFIQEGEIRRIGSVESRKVDVRLICATHRNLKQAASMGTFREDLFFRINVMPIELPALRERGSDVNILAETFLRNQCKTLGKENLSFSKDALEAMQSYSWPGNVRELENAVERATILCETNIIDSNLLGISKGVTEVEPISPPSNPTQLEPETAIAENIADSNNPAVDDNNVSLEDYFQRFVLENQHTMSETELAQKLGVSRKCLWERRQRLGIPRKKTSKH